MYCLELPAGLCDSGEAPEVTAVRELKEETGYTAEIIDVSPSLIVCTPRPAPIITITS
jgi:8-oxo-dGTP pyrophosphatase MutT (NUDIX family)